MRPTSSSKLSLGRFWWNEGTTYRHCTLLVVVGAYPQQVARNVNFLVVDCSSSYNAIFGRPTLNSWKTVTSTYHLLVKFPTKHGIGQVQRDQLPGHVSHGRANSKDEY